MRIQKLLANAGYGSRRMVESWIQAGRIRVNGQVATLGQRISDQDRIHLDKKRLTLSADANGRIIALYKPVGVVCTRKDHVDRATVFKYLPPLKRQRWISIGRLDINSSGLLLFTNNGDWAHRLMHPSNHVDREYIVRVLGEVDEQILKKMCNGVMLDGKLARFTDIVAAGGQGANRWFYVVLMEGRNRAVRRIWASQGLQVSRLTRVRYGSYILPRGKKPGSCWELTAKEVSGLITPVNRSNP